MKIVSAILLLAMCATLAVRGDDLTTITGITYKNATITGHDAIGLKIMFDDGFARVRFRDLPDKFRAKYGYDPVAEAAQLRREAQMDDQQAAALRIALERQNKETARQDAEVEATAIKVQLQGRLVSNTEDGLLLMKQYMVPGAQGDEVRQEIFLLRGYPHPSQVANNQQITVTALPDGTYKYSAEDGTLKTVRAYRYVEAPSPPDEQELQGSALDVLMH